MSPELNLSHPEGERARRSGALGFARGGAGATTQARCLAATATSHTTTGPGDTTDGSERRAPRIPSPHDPESSRTLNPHEP